jgi:hypothetical protein
MAVDLSKEGLKNTFIRIRIRDEYSFEIDIEKILEELLRAEG